MSAKVVKPSFASAGHFTQLQLRYAIQEGGEDHHRQKTDAGLRGPDLRVVGCDTEVAGRQEAGAAAEGVAVDPPEDRLEAFYRNDVGPRSLVVEADGIIVSVSVSVAVALPKRSSRAWADKAPLRHKLRAGGVEALLQPALEEPEDGHGKRIGEGGGQIKSVGPDDASAAFGLGEVPVAATAPYKPRERRLESAGPSIAVPQRRVVFEDDLIEDGAVGHEDPALRAFGETLPFVHFDFADPSERAACANSSRGVCAVGGECKHLVARAGDYD